jgi:Family of unknown function (DUF6580)
MGTHQNRQPREHAGLTFVFLLAGAAFAVTMRLAPYWFGMGREQTFLWNAAPVGALCLFAGARLRGYKAFLYPALVMLASDLLLTKPLAAQGLSAFSWGTVLIYVSFTLYAVLGQLAHRTGLSWTLIPACLAGSVQFYLVTNFLSWVGDHGVRYRQTFGGLLDCYYAGLPFLRNTAAGDLFYAGLFFGLYAVLAYIPQRQKASQPA